MPKAQALLSSPPLGWPHTGKRGRTRSNRSPYTPEHSAALFLLSLSYPHRRTFIHAPPPPPPAETEDNERMPDHCKGARSHECSVCPKKFRTGRALGGHMKSHLERDLKGRIVKKKMRKISSLCLGLELGFGLGEAREEEMNGAEALNSSSEEQSMPPASPFRPW